MSKRKRRAKKLRRKRPVRHAHRRRRAAIHEHVSAFVEDERMSPRQERIVRAAMPRPAIYHTSHWLSDGIERAVTRVGCTPLEAISVLERMQRWAYRTERLSQLDLAMQLAGLELRRRSYGAEPTVISLPEPTSPLEVPVDVLLHTIVQWEGWSYAARATRDSDSSHEAGGIAHAALELAHHLAETDGVPIRPERLEPSALAAELMEPDPELGPPPEGWLAGMLGFTAKLYERLASQDLVDTAVASRVAHELGRIGVGSTGPSHAA